MPSSRASGRSALKRYQQAAWSAGDYTSVAGSTVIASELLAEALDIHPGELVLDAACGSGNATIAAARRYAEVTGLDFAPVLLADAARRLDSEHVRATLVQGDLEALPFGDDSFDVVISAFGAMFAPDQERTAAELSRVCRPGGRIGLASWTAEGALGQLFRITSSYIPPTPGVPAPTAWGDPRRLRELFGGSAGIRASTRDFVFRYRSPGHWMQQFKDHFGPTRMTFALLPPELSETLERELLTIWPPLNRATDGSLVAPVQYLEAIVTKTA